VRLAGGDVAWLSGVPWPGAFWPLPAGSGALALVAAEADLAGVARPGGELVLDAGDLFRAAQAGPGERDLGSPVQTVGEVGEVLASQGGSRRRAKPISSPGL
jgi:hypothetical protein